MSFVGKCLILSVSIAAACAADKDAARFSPGPASSYASRSTIDKVTIGLDVYDTEDKARPAFGKVNPYTMGILPVLLVMQNDTGKALNLSGLKVAYIGPDGREIEATPARDVRFLNRQARPNQTGGSRPNPLPVPIPRGNKNKLDAWEIEGRAFAARMLPAGDAANGFFYFQTKSRQGSKLYITGIREAATGKELFYFEVPLK